MQAKDVGISSIGLASISVVVLFCFVCLFCIYRVP